MLIGKTKALKLMFFHKGYNGIELIQAVYDEFVPYAIA